MKMRTFSKEQLLVLNRFAAYYRLNRILGVGLVSGNLMKVICIETDRRNLVFYEYYDRSGNLVRSEYDKVEDYKKKL